MSTYFISDIHLNASSAENSQLLLNFLQSKGKNADAIYILGDLFSIWFGDDITATYSDQLFTTLRNLTDNGVPIYFMRGNRDFLVGNKFSNATGVKLLTDPCVINVYNESVLLTHGDMLCTADKDYQKFRSLVQHPLAKAYFLSLPRFIRTKLGRYVQMKAKSRRNYESQNIDLYDVIPASAQQWFSKFNVTKMIHGHTHKPAIHIQDNTTRIVLGDWNSQNAKILIWNNSGFELEDLQCSYTKTASLV